MALYHEAASILETVNNGKTSLKAEVFGKKGWKSDGKTLFALTSEAAKWSSILAEVVEKSGILNLEKQVWAFFLTDYCSGQWLRNSLADPASLLTTNTVIADTSPGPDPRPLTLKEGNRSPSEARLERHRH